MTAKLLFEAIRNNVSNNQTISPIIQIDPITAFIIAMISIGIMILIYSLKK